MQEITCKNCGSNDFTEEGRYLTCRFCGTKYILDKEKDNAVTESTIALNEDVVRLLHLWREDPEDGARYAKLILQIDPNNAQARRKLAEPKVDTKSSGGCYIATAVYGSYDCPPVWVLRRFRDNTLAKSLCGRAFIRVYYAFSPTLVKWFGKSLWFTRFWRGRLDRLVAKLKEDGVEDTAYQDRRF